MTGSATDHGSQSDELSRFRRRNWTAIGVGTVIAFVASVAPALATVTSSAWRRPRMTKAAKPFTSGLAYRVAGQRIP